MAGSIKKTKFHKDTFDKTTEDRRRKVQAVAINEFASKGYSATSINDIARKAHISIGAMYSYFASKEDLFLAIVNYSYNLMEHILKEVVDKSSDIFDCVERMLAASRKFAMEYPQLNQIYLDITTQAHSHMSVKLSNKLEIITPHVLSNFIKQAKMDGRVSNELDERVISYCIDNIFMMYQFSFSSDYYKERMKIYIGEERLKDIDKVEECIIKFIRVALEK
ncbi:MAG TPA: TetR/AcrR family transcriptional regulator [Lachnospiraceae bacterium]|nr:TetR/AcrR family transcriptional regulator [Lachnospiraceae bacterium]